MAMPRLMIRWIAVVVIPLAAGCNWLLPGIFLTEHKKTVPAEFAKLKGKQVAVVVWAEPETLFDYPHVRLELSSYVTDKIRAELPSTRLIDPPRIEDYVQQILDADPEQIGKHFGVDMVVYIELLEFQIRDPRAPDFVRPHIRASVAVYDLKADPDEPRRYDLSVVDVVHPEHAPLLVSRTNIVTARQEAYVKFAEAVARKFYPHEVALN
jgi:hypothetical protein